jgi:glutamate-ammonia-ligase adenylyltransferase
MRMRIEEQAAAVDENGNATGGLSSGSNIKRGPGGIIDIEFLVEMLQLVHARKNSRLRTPNTLVALDELRVAGILTHDEHYLFDKGYRLLRLIEGRLRLMNATVRNRLPTDPVELAKLAHLTRFQSSEALIDAYETSTLRIRERFEAIFAATET